jgi:GT2 family glycosyltransferase
LADDFFSFFRLRTMEKPTIYYFTPYSFEKNIGDAYNQYMELLPNDEDWACFIDGDAMFLIPDFGHVIADVVERYPDTGMFTAYTNRVANRQQLYRGKFSDNADIRYHRNIARVCKEVNHHNVTDLQLPISGVIMVIQKKTWKEFPFSEGMLGVDNDISRRMLQSGRKVQLMQGIYMLHYYRFNEGREHTKHLQL